MRSRHTQTFIVLLVRHRQQHSNLHPQIVRYSTIAGGIFWLVWKTFKQRNAAYKLDPRPLDLAQIRREV